MTVLTPSYAALARAFGEHQVRYLIIGSFAVAAHGHVRYVKDLDVWVERSPDNARRIVRALAAFGFDGLGITEEDFTTNVVLELGYEPNMVDLTSIAPGLDFAACHARRVEVELDGVALAFLDRESLIETKREIGRTKDVQDVAGLEAAPPAPLADRIRAVEALRRADLDETGDPDRPIARAVRRKLLLDPLRVRSW